MANFLTAVFALATAFIPNRTLSFWILRFCTGLTASAANVIGYIWSAEFTTVRNQNVFNLIFGLASKQLPEAFYIAVALWLQEWLCCMPRVLCHTSLCSAFLSLCRKASGGFLRSVKDVLEQLSCHELPVITENRGEIKQRLWQQSPKALLLWTNASIRRLRPQKTVGNYSLRTRSFDCCSTAGSS